MKLVCRWSPVAKVIRCCLWFFISSLFISKNHTPLWRDTVGNFERHLYSDGDNSSELPLALPSYWTPVGFHYYERTGDLPLHPLATYPFTLEKCQYNNGVLPIPKDWTAHVPAFLIAGAPKAGTTFLAQLLRKHPSVLRPNIKELRYFHELPLESDGSVLVDEARQYLHQQGGYPISELQHDTTKITYDATPNYLFRSSLVMAPILCTCPWIKIIVIIRDPVQRAFSEYRYRVQRQMTNSTMDDLIAEELHVMTLAGLPADIPGSQQETDAWNRYHALTVTGMLGKGMYDIQLRHVLEALQLFQLDVSTHLLVLHSEELPSFNTYRNIIQFLGLPLPPKVPHGHRVNEGTIHVEMSKWAQEILTEWYEPHQQRLENLLSVFQSGGRLADV